MTKQLSEDGKINLVRRNVSEIINEKKISSFLKKGTVYCGYETSGEIGNYNETFGFAESRD